MIKYNFTKDNIRFVEKAIELRNKGFYVDSKQLTQVYNEVLNKRVNVTNCGACSRARINELENALKIFKSRMELSGFTNTDDYINEINAIEDEMGILKPSESVSEDKVDNEEEENKELTKAEMMNERMARVRAARKNKK